MIDLENCRKVFDEYLNNYDKENFLIVKKIEHTYNVMNISKEIANSLNLSKEEVSLATLIGLLHDIGRFEQAKIAGTYVDTKQIDHAQIGVKLLFEENKIREFLPEDFEYDEIIKKAVYEHNKFKISEELNEKEKLFAKIVRDADKIDIYRMFTVDDILKLGYASGYMDIENFTEEVEEAFYKNEQLPKDKLQTMLDWFLNAIAFTYDINFKKSFSILKERNYINIILDKSEKIWTNKIKDLNKIRNHINEYIG